MSIVVTDELLRETLQANPFLTMDGLFDPNAPDFPECRARLESVSAERIQAVMDSLPTVSSAGLRRGHAELLEGALAETRRTLTELGRVASAGAGGAGALGDQDSENARRFGGWDAPELQVKGAPQEIRVV
ncbi:hypothetical protein HNP40_000924 [Mycobacteroides chelonae]|nr:hypothetical protein [Mycobacteroides chelonae]